MGAVFALAGWKGIRGSLSTLCAFFKYTMLGFYYTSVYSVCQYIYSYKKNIKRIAARGNSTLVIHYSLLPIHCFLVRQQQYPIQRSVGILMNADAHLFIFRL